MNIHICYRKYRCVKLDEPFSVFVSFVVFYFDCDSSQTVEKTQPILVIFFRVFFYYMKVFVSRCGSPTQWNNLEHSFIWYSCRINGDLTHNRTTIKWISTIRFRLLYSHCCSIFDKIFVRSWLIFNRKHSIPHVIMALYPSHLSWPHSVVFVFVNSSGRG